MDELLDILDSTEEPKTQSTEIKQPAPAEPVKENKGGKINLWEDHIAPLPIDKEGMLRFNRMFAVQSHGDVPGEVVLLIEQLTKLLISKGFTLRYDGNKQDKAATQAYTAGKSRCETYLPWKGFNKDLTAKLNKPSEKAYGYASTFHKAFNKIPPTVRAIVARNVHVMLGDESNTPLNLFITYTPDGAETKADVKYETTGNMAFYIYACEDLGIPVFNLKNDTAKERIVEFLNTLK